MKRESKAYSYKDQLEELQLRRELADRKKKEGKNAGPKELTAKQKEAIRIQTNKENITRKKLTEVCTNCNDLHIISIILIIQNNISAGS